MNSPNTTDTTPDRDQQAMRQVLMISYDFPPMNGPGALRIAQFAKHLPQAGWEPITVTVHDGYSSRPLDSASSNQVQARVLRVREFDPIKRLAGLGRLAPQPTRPGHSGRFRASVQRWYTGLAFPDRDWLWQRPAIRTARRILASDEMRPQAIFSSSPSMSNHCVALKLKQQTGLPWIADFRDFWAFSSSFSPGGWRKRHTQQLESKICRRCDALVSISDYYCREYASAYGIRNTFTIMNGFDPADFPVPDESRDFPSFSIAHAGGFYSGQRHPEILLKVIRRLADRVSVDLTSVRLDLFCNPESSIQAMIDRYDLRAIATWHGFVPYQELIPRLMNSFLLLVVTHDLDDCLSTKVFDYMGCRRPIITVTPGGTLASIIESQKLGLVANSENESQFEKRFLELWSSWKRGDKRWLRSSRQLPQQYTRPYQAKQLARVLDSVACPPRTG